MLDNLTKSFVHGNLHTQHPSDTSINSIVWLQYQIFFHLFFHLILILNNNYVETNVETMPHMD